MLLHGHFILVWLPWIQRIQKGVQARLWIFLFWMMGIFIRHSQQWRWVDTQWHACTLDQSIQYKPDVSFYLALMVAFIWALTRGDMDVLQGLPVGQFYHVRADNQKPYYRVYGGLQDNGSWVAPSSYPGVLQTGVEIDLWRRWFLDGPRPYRSWYCLCRGAGVVMPEEFNWVHLRPPIFKPKQSEGEEKLRWNWNTPIVLGATLTTFTWLPSTYTKAPTREETGRASPDLTTNDKNKQKQEESGGLSADNTSAENHCTIFTVAESPVDENTIWVGTDDGNIQYTTDAGKTWAMYQPTWPQPVLPHSRGWAVLNQAVLIKALFMLL